MILLVACVDDSEPDPPDVAADTVAAAPAQMALDGEGLRLVDGASGSTRLLAFGAAADEVVATLTRLAGAPREQGHNADCRLDYAAWADGLTLWAQNDRFVGWAVDGRQSGSDRLTTMAGAGTGVTRAEVASAYALDVRTTSLGVEFSAGDLHGILDGAGDNARVTHLWGGTTCIFR